MSKVKKKTIEAKGFAIQIYTEDLKTLKTTISV